MLAKIQTVLSQSLKPGETVLAGISGGADSVALLHALVALGYRPHVCHLNHQWRGAESDADAQFVRELAGTLQLPVTIQARQVPHDEDSARQARYDFFQDCAIATGIKKIVLAHTADDQVETFLMRLLRGAGVPGLVGIWPERQIGIVRVLRPMLKIRRDEIIEYLTGHGLRWREDASNQDREFLRNRVRHELLPLLERDFNPSVRDSLARTAEILRDEDFYLLHHVAERHYLGICRQDSVNVRSLAAVPAAVQRRVLRFWLGGETETAGVQYSFEHIEAMRRLALGEDPGAETSLPGDLVVYREYDWLRKARRAELEPVTGQWTLNVPGETTIRELRAHFVVGGDQGEQFDADLLGERLTVRTWREGDRFRPLGMLGEKKLQDFFVDEKVPRRQRVRVPLVCVGDGRIAWVVGCRISDEFKVTLATKRVVWMQYFEAENIRK
jgi:tRNA(Ile)-lysidine synthase